MALSDGIKIACIVALPIVFFVLLFALAVWYRKSRGGTRIKHPEWGIVQPRQRRASSHCAQCSKETHRRASSSVKDTRSIARHSGLHGSGGRDSTRSLTAGERDSVMQPHFAEKSVMIRRLSASRQDDTVLRVNSVSSALPIELGATEDELPLGGRKSSIGMIYPAGHGAGGRRPSVLNDPLVGVLDVRRISTGGAEDVIRVRSASQGSLSRRVDLGGSTIYAEHPSNSPALSPSHPFSAASLSRTSTFNAGVFNLQPPPRGSSKSPSHTTLRSPIAWDSPTAYPSPMPPTSGGPMEALKSPPETIFSDDSAIASDIFGAWKGFSGSSGGAIAQQLEVEESISPETPNLDPKNEQNGADDEFIHLTFPIPRLTGIPPITALPIPQVQVAIDMASPTVPHAENTVDFTLAPTMTPNGSSLAPLDPAGSARTDSAVSTPSEKRGSKITYLADVVRANEERRRAAQAEGSSTVCMASLEERKPPKVSSYV